MMGDDGDSNGTSKNWINLANAGRMPGALDKLTVSRLATFLMHEFTVFCRYSGWAVGGCW
jgi:hypothetical protein